ncbi:pseudouridine-metabolizing bifunctional protein [Planoprotostelium fungivorum]|uniref:Pseudouridine-metabolizing bifunctional protein n=1 Tax=Planoprotostelium fungivorum TaxID=1890364 RepID=A0A2P6MN46_9EUKA|nr:pseudouridine-metabolizing bifunctional protein [Planoprotostelium fungivorum]
MMLLHIFLLLSFLLNVNAHNAHPSESSFQFLSTSISESRGPFILLDTVADALRRGLPVVALESTVISHGLPYPDNLQTGLDLEETVRLNGAVPATIALMDGSILIGLNHTMMERLAVMGHEAHKTSRRDIAYVVATRKAGATTVSATSWIAAQVGISVFATGGIGGVHRNGEVTLDVSADLTELGRTSIAVVCAGVKSILDIPKTLEYLETQGVPVVGYNTTEFPAFFTRKSGLKTSATAVNDEECARIIRANRQLGLEGGIVIAVPVPEDEEAELQIVEEATNTALKESITSRVTGKDATPFLLKRIAELTEGKSLKANIALIKNNAATASRIALQLARLEGGERPVKVEGGRGRPVVVGGMVLDIVSTSSSAAIMETSNPGGVLYRQGGVGRNALEVLYRLGQEALFISAVGQDPSASVLLSGLRKITEFSSDGIYVSNRTNTAVYNAILDHNGHMLVAVADMAIFDEISSNFVRNFKEELTAAPVVIMDGNIPEATMDEVLSSSSNVIFEPTSVPKSMKILPRLSRVSVLTPNLDELFALTGGRPQDVSVTTYKERCITLMDRGVRAVLLKMGAEGVMYASSEALDGCEEVTSSTSSGKKGQVFFYHFEAPKVDKIISVTGAGDSLVGGYAWGITNGRSVCQAVRLGLTAAKLSLENPASEKEQLIASSFVRGISQRVPLIQARTVFLTVKDSDEEAEGEVKLLTSFLVAALILASFMAAVLIITNKAPIYETASRTEAPVLPFIAFGKNGAVAAEQGVCSDVGVTILKEGGNAVDAAIASTLCLGLAQPHSSGIGGGAVIVIRMANGTEEVIDSREVAPEGAYPTMYVNRTRDSTYGPRAVAVPGELRGLELAFQKYGSGRVTWKRLFKEAIETARAGVPISHELYRAIQSERSNLLNSNLKDIFMPNGTTLVEGNRYQNPKLAETLEEIANNGTWSYYHGQIAANIVWDIVKAGGNLTLGDLETFSPRISRPMHGSYRGYDIACAGPPFSGCPIMLQTLNVFEKYAVDQIDRKRNPTVASQILSESLKFAFANRVGLADPYFYNVTGVVDGMTDKQHAELLKAKIDLDHAYNWTHYVDLVDPQDSTPDAGTMHLSVVDRDKNAVAITSTINTYFGSQFLSTSTGIILNNEMDDFGTPGTFNSFNLPPSKINFPEPKKKPLSSMSPTIITKDGQVKMVVGASGGSRIPTGTLQVISSILDSRMKPDYAVWQPRIHTQWQPNIVYVDPNLPEAQPDVYSKMKEVGNDVTVRATSGSCVQVVVVEDDNMMARLIRHLQHLAAVQPSSMPSQRQVTRSIPSPRRLRRPNGYQVLTSHTAAAKLIGSYCERTKVEFEPELPTLMSHLMDNSPLAQQLALTSLERDFEKATRKDNVAKYIPELMMQLHHSGPNKGPINSKPPRSEEEKGQKRRRESTQIDVRYVRRDYSLASPTMQRQSPLHASPLPPVTVSATENTPVVDVVHAAQVPNMAPSAVAQPPITRTELELLAMRQLDNLLDISQRRVRLEDLSDGDRQEIDRITALRAAASSLTPLSSQA